MRRRPPHAIELSAADAGYKPEGSGIGLALSRQIVEAHGGRLALKNRADARGCEARLLLPGTALGRRP